MDQDAIPVDQFKDDAIPMQNNQEQSDKFFGISPKVQNQINSTPLNAPVDPSAVVPGAGYESLPSMPLPFTGNRSPADQPIVADENGNPVQSHSPLAEQNPSGAIPVAQFKDDGAPAGAIPVENFQDDSDKYQSIPQQYLTEAEGLAQGIAGPVATAAEVALGVPREDILGRAQANPGEHGASEAYSMLFSPYSWIKGASAIADGVEGYLGISKYAPTAVKLATTAGKSIAEMMAFQGGEELTKKIENDPTQTASTAAANIGLAGLIGGGIPLGAAGVSSLWDAAGKPATEAILNKIKINWDMGNPQTPDGLTISPLLRKIVTNIGGVPEDTIDKYLAQHNAVNSAPDFNDVVFHNVDQIQNVNDNMESSKAALSTAKDNFQKVQDDLKDHLTDAKVGARDANKFAQSALDSANLKLEQNLQQNAFDQAPIVTQAVQKLKDNAFALSNASAEGLSQVPGVFDLTPMYDAGKEAMQRQIDLGFPERAEAIGSVLDNFQQRYGTETPYSNVKTIIQGLRQRGNFDFNASEISKGTAGTFNALQGVLDSSLKEAVPSYQKAMQPTADAFSLLSQLGGYGTPEDAARSIRSMSSNPLKYATDMPVLRNLEQSTGIQFTRPIDQFASPNLRKMMAESIPQYAKAQQTAAALDAIKRPEVQQMMEQALAANPAQKELNAAQDNLVIAKLRQQGLNGLTTQNVESAMKAVMNNRSIMAQEKFAHIPGMAGQSIPDILHLLAIRDAFEKQYTHGSRNVNLWSKMVGGLAGLLGHWGGNPIISAIGGQGLGAMVGGSIDTQGPAVTKKLLDKYISFFGDLPKAVGASPESTQGALIHFLDSGAKPDGTAFKDSANYLNAAKRGHNAVKMGAKAIFDTTKSVLPDSQMPDKDRTQKLNDKLKDINDNPQQMFAFGGKVGHYMPKHGQALAQIGSGAVGALNAARPVIPKMSPLDADMEPSEAAKRTFNSQLEVAQNPLMLMHHVQQGTLLPQHLATVKQIYPGLTESMGQEIHQAMTDHISKGNTVPYNIRQGLSMMMGQPLDSTFTPQSMQATIAANAQPMQPQQKKGGSNSGRPTNKGLEQVAKGAELYQTPSEMRVEDRRA